MTLTVEGPADLAGPSFDRPLHLLEHFGVDLPRAQRTLLYLGEDERPHIPTGYAMAVMPLLDPRTGRPMRCVDVDTDAPPSTIVVPSVFEFDHTAWAGHLGEGALRFPSVPGRLCHPVINGERHGDLLIGEPQPYRLWDLWPLMEEDAGVVVRQVLKALQVGAYERMCAKFRQDAELDEPCQLLEDWGTGVLEHDHVYDQDGGFDRGEFVCLDAEAEYERIQEELYWFDEAGFERHSVTRDPQDKVRHEWPRVFEVEVDLPWPLNEVWQMLHSSSRRNTLRALDSYEGADRRTVISTEREFSPWSLY